MFYTVSEIILRFLAISMSILNLKGGRGEEGLFPMFVPCLGDPVHETFYEAHGF